MIARGRPLDHGGIGDAYAIAPRLFRAVEGTVRGCGQPDGIADLAGFHRRDAHADGQADGLPVVDRRDEALDFYAAPRQFGDVPHPLGRRPNQHHDELFPAVACREVARAMNLLLEAPGDLDQASIAERMPVAVVDLLEMIDVDHDERQRQPLPARPGQFALQLVVEVGAVEDAGEAVLHGGAI
ncbi:MAG TPA: hypothetical protein VF816_16115 [Rhodocyclaceae bacterium]